MIGFEYLAPRSLEETLPALTQERGQVVVLAGGTNLLVDLRDGIVRPDIVVDLRYLEDLKQIHRNQKRIEIGALSTLASIERSPIIRQQAPILGEMARHFGNPLIRNVATLGGNLAYASPAADVAVPLLALGATLQLRAASGEQRDLALSEFFTDRHQTVMRPTELITQIRFPTLTKNTHWFYYKLGRRKAGTISIVSASVVVELDDQSVKRANIALGAVAPVPFRAHQAESVLEGNTISNETITKCLETLETEVVPIDDMYASSAYRTAMARALVGKALKQFSTPKSKEQF